jgi:putative membrane protein
MGSRSMRGLTILLSAFSLFGWPTIVFSHVGGAPTEAALSPGWTVSPLLGTLLISSLVLYAVGLRRLLARTKRARRLHRRRATFFFLGWTALVVALCSPLDGLGATLFSAHMLQHEVLMLVAAPLLVLGRPLPIWSWALPERWRHRVSAGVRQPSVRLPWRTISSALGGWLAHALTLWLWHVPFFFDAALMHPALHEIQHASFLAGALLFWWCVIGHMTPKNRGYALLSLFTTMVHTSLLGALLTLSPSLWYVFYAETAPLVGADPVQDQQLGGLIMWIPGAIAYVIGALISAAQLVFSEDSPAHHALRSPAMERHTQ